MSAVEQANSRTVAYEQGNPIGTREFYCYPYDTEQDVLALFGTLLPTKLSAWPTGPVGTPPVTLVFRDFDITRDPNVEGGWHVRLIYKDGSGTVVSAWNRLQPNDDGYVTLRLSSEGRFMDMWRQFDTDDEFQQAVFSKTDLRYRPLFAPDRPLADIGGRKIDIAGTAATVVVPVQRMVVDITTTIWPKLQFFRRFLGTRNNTAFLGCDPYSAVLMGAEASQMQPGRWIVSLNIEVDKYYFLRQAPMRNASGYVITDDGDGGSNSLGRGQAKQVAWFQMYAEVTKFQDIHPALQAAFLP
jgi:hypothetical protein